MTARERGVRAPAVVLARGSDRGAVVVQEFVAGRTLDDLAPAECTPALLTAVWQQVALLHAARIAHHDLVASSVLVDDAGRPWLVDFGNAVTGATDADLSEDVAELLASLAMRTDTGPVVATAMAVLGRDALESALPGLAPLTRSAVTRAEERATPGRLSALRREVRRRLELPDPARPEFAPSGPVALVLVGLGAVTVLVGLPLVAGADTVLQSVEVDGWRWLGGAVVLALLARAVAAVAGLVPVGRRLALGRIFRATLVADGATVLHGRAGRRMSAARFLERAGLPPGPARRAVLAAGRGTALAAGVLTAATLVTAGVSGRRPDWRTPHALVPTMLVCGGAWALVLIGQWLAGRRSADRSRRDAARRPWNWRTEAAQLGWAVLALVLEAATLAAALHGVGGRVPILATVTVSAALRLLWSVVPATGAPGAAEAALVLALAALGGPLASACAAVVTFRLLTFWIPAASGALLSGAFEHRLLT
jgi:undecaprenyl-diphosphatase